MRKERKKLTLKKENLTSWGEEDVDSRDEEKKKEEAHLYLIAFDNEIDKVYDSSLSCFSDDDDNIDDLYHEL